MEGCWRSNDPSTPAFIINSAASHHLTGNRLLFDRWSFVPVVDTITVGNAYRMEIVGTGSVRRGRITLPGVLYVPALPVNVVSVSQLAAMDYKVEFDHRGFLVKDSLGGEEVGRGSRDDQGLYMVESLRVPLGRGRLPDFEEFEAAMTP